ncbi:hypothetical protein BASA81_012143 [Batrachochytrium salamandrivorans]|nr:hypothetical protein BASA81_012143 [Batrachochytrium salamandrivorans]
MPTVEYVLECLEHSAAGVEEICALHLKSEWFFLKDHVQRLLRVCQEISSSCPPHSALLLARCTEIFLENRIDQAFPNLFATLVRQLVAMTGSARLKSVAVECLKEIELVHPGLVSSLAAFGTLDQDNLPLLLRLTLAAHDQNYASKPKLVSETLELLSTLSRWERCQAVQWLLLLGTPADSLLHNHRVVEGLGLITSPVCLQTLFLLLLGSSGPVSSAFRSQLYIQTTAFASNESVPKLWQKFALELRKRVVGSASSSPLTRFDSVPVALGALDQALEKPDYLLAAELSWVVDDFWRDESLADRAFALYSVLLTQEQFAPPVVQHLVDQLIMRPSSPALLSRLIVLMQSHAQVLMEPIANAISTTKRNVSELFGVMTVLRSSHKQQVVQAMERFVDGDWLVIVRDWPVVTEFLALCRLLVMDNLRQSPTSPDMVVVSRLVRKLRLKSKHDLILQDECNRVWGGDEHDDKDDDENEEKGEEVSTRKIDFQDFITLQRLDSAHISLEWTGTMGGEELLFAMQLWVDLDHTSCSCYDFATQDYSHILAKFSPSTGVVVIPFALPKSELALPVRVFFHATACADGGQTLDGPIGSLVVELGDLLLPVQRVPRGFSPTTRYCLCLDGKPWDLVERFVSKTFPHAVHQATGEDHTWRIAVKLPPSFHLAFLLLYSAATQRLVVRLQTDLWLVLPQVDSLFRF